VRAAPRRLALAGAALLLCGCYTIRYHRAGVAAEAGTPREQWHHGALGGFLDASGAVRLDEMCPEGVAWVENQVTFGDAILQYLTGGAAGLRTARSGKKGAPAVDFAVFHDFSLWTPSTVRVACARARGSQAQPASRKLKVAVVRLAARTGVDEKVADLFSDALAGELRKRPNLAVISDADVAALLGVERKKQMLGCTDAGCFAEIGGALGVDRIVHGSVGRVGGSLVVNLTSVDARKGTPVASVSERLQSASDEAFLDALPRMGDAILLEWAPAR
jgi:TolB-like protein